MDDILTLSAVTHFNKSWAYFAYDGKHLRKKLTDIPSIGFCLKLLHGYIQAVAYMPDGQRVAYLHESIGGI